MTQPNEHDSPSFWARLYRWYFERWKSDRASVQHALDRDRIVIFGQYKSGTTGLFTKIRNSLEYAPRELFEAENYLAHPTDRRSGVLAKIIVGIHDDGTPISDVRGFLEFEKQIYLIRDPRDRLVSGVLFQAHRYPGLADDSAKAARILSLLERKERDPASVSLVKIILELFDRNDSLLENYLQAETRRLAWIETFESQLSQHCLVRYEDFVHGQLEKLEAYLGMRLAGTATVDQRFAHVPRTLSSGDWKNWFTDQDIPTFRPLSQEYLSRHGYETSWELSPKPLIRPEHATQYVRRNIVARRHAA